MNMKPDVSQDNLVRRGYPDIGEHEIQEELKELLKKQVQEEGLFDYEIAAQLRVHPTLVSRIRKSLGLSKNKRFVRRFEQKYGKGAVDTFRRMVKDPEKSLSDVARHFGFTREYARHVYSKIYGQPYSVEHKKKLLARRKKRIEEKSQASKRMRVLRRVREKMSSHGISTDVKRRGRASLILSNGCKVALKISSSPVTINQRQYFHFNNNGCSCPDCDFFICICMHENKETHYVIPAHAMPKTTLSILHPSSHNTKYAQYKEAWELLKQGCVCPEYN